MQLKEKEMKTKFISLISLLFTILCVGAFTSCEDEDRTYQGPVFYEFSPSEAGQSASGSNNLIEKSVSAMGQTQFCVQMIKKNNETTRVRFRIAKEIYFVGSTSKYSATKPAGTQDKDYTIAATTAQQGNDYEVITGNGVEYDAKSGIGFATLPANELFTNVTLNIKNVGNTMIYVVLEDTDNARANLPTSLLAIGITEE